MRRLSTRLNIGALALAIGACHWAPVPLEELQSKREEASCRWAVRCGLASSQLDCANFKPQLGSAWSWWTAPGELLNLREYAEAGLVRYEPSIAAACLEAWVQTSCASWRAVPTCSEAFIGELPEGASCLWSGCEPGLVCLTDFQTCGGLCRRYTPVGQSPEEVPCEPGVSTIYRSDAGFRCEARPALGEACDPCGYDESTDCSPACADGLTCEVLFDGGVRHCVPLEFLPRGAACQLWQHCAPSDHCAADDAGLDRCLALGDVGEPCSNGCLLGLSCERGVCALQQSGPSGCDVWAQDCDAGMYCEANLVTTYGACVARVEAGTPCGYPSGVWCSRGTSCRGVSDGGAECLPLATPCE